METNTFMEKSNSPTKPTILSQKAEELLIMNSSNPTQQLSESDTLKLLHELEVHQIELEAQNQELKQFELIHKQQMIFTAAINAMAENIILMNNAEEILENTNRILGETLQLDRALIYYVSFEKNCITGLCEWLRIEHSDITFTKGNYSSLEMFKCSFSEIKKTQKYIVSQFNNVNELFVKDGADKILHEQLNIKSLIWYPFDFDEHGFYLFTLNQILEQRYWTQEEINFLDSVSKQVSLALMKIQLFEERKRGNESEEKYHSDFTVLHSILESPVDIIIFALDKNYCYTAFTNFHKETIKKIWGVDIQIGMNMLDIISNPEDRQKAKNNFDKALRGEYFVLTEEYGDTELHRTVYENYYSAIRNSEGEIVGISIFVVDFTKQNQAEYALRVNEKKFRNLFESMNQGVVYQDSEGKIISANPAAERILGLSLEQMQGRSSIDPRWKAISEDGNAFPGEDHPSMVALRTSKKVLNSIFGVFNPALEAYTWIKVDAIPQFLPGETKAHQVFATFEDITERKLAEEKLIFINKAIESTRDAIGISDSTGKHFYQNKALTNLFEYSTAEELQAAGGGLAVVYDPAVAKEMFENIKAGKSWSGELEMITKSGRVFQAYERADAVLDKDGKNIGLIGIITDITERKQAEQALKESNSKLSILTDNIPASIAYVNANTLKYEFVNKGYESAFGMPSAKIIGSYVKEIIGETNFQFAIKYIEEVKSGKSVSYVNEFNFVSGKRWISVNYVPDFDENGNVKSIITFNYDITEIRRAEEALFEINSKLDLAMQSAKMAWWEMDIATGLISFDKRKAEMLGYSPERFTHYSDFTVLQHPEDFDKAMEAMQKHIDGQAEKYIVEYRILDSSGNYRWFYDNGSITKFDDKGTPLSVTGFALDITERKRAEEEINHSHNMLAKTESLAHIGSWEWDSTKDKVTWSDELFRIFKINPADGAPSFKEHSKIYPYDMDELKYAVNNALNDGTPYELELKAVRADGEIRICFARGYREISSEKGIFLYGSIQDITERKLAEEEIQNRNLELAELNASKDKFFSIIAHDLRSPFNGFLGLTKLMAEETSDFTLKELQEISKKMQNSANNLYKLLENLLEWSRIQRGMTKFKPQLCKLDDIIKQNVEMELEYANQKNIEILINISGSYEAKADISMLDSVLRNMISNSIKFTPRGGKIEIGIISSSDNCVYIKDNGIGMDPEILGNLFKLDQNVSRPGTEKEPSTGLGLLLCKDFVEKHSGRIWAESEEGKGSTFYFTLPFHTEGQ